MDFWQWGVGPDLAIRLKPFLLVYLQLNELGMIDTSMICVDENAFHRHMEDLHPGRRTNEGSRLQLGFDAAVGVDLHQLGRIQENLVQRVEGLRAIIAGNGQVHRVASPQLGSEVLDVRFG